MASSSASSARWPLLGRPPRRLDTQFARYFVAGTISFFCDLTVLALLHGVAGLGLLTAGAIAFVVGVSINYAIAVRWVFPARRMEHRPWTEFAIYVGVGLTGLGLNELVLWGLSERLDLHFVLAKGVSGLVVLAWTFGIRRMLLFRDARARRLADVPAAPRASSRAQAAN